MPAGVSIVGIGHGAEAFGVCDAAFDVADAGEVFVELDVVAVAELLLQRAGVIEHEVQDGTLRLLAGLERRGADAVGAFAEEPLEEQARIRLRAASA